MKLGPGRMKQLLESEDLRNKQVPLRVPSGAGRHELNGFVSIFTGGLFDLTGDYRLSLIVIAVAFLVSAVVVLVIPTRRRLQSSVGRSVIDYVSVNTRSEVNRTALTVS